MAGHAPRRTGAAWGAEVERMPLRRAHMYPWRQQRMTHPQSRRNQLPRLWSRLAIAQPRASSELLSRPRTPHHRAQLRSRQFLAAVQRK